VLAVVRGEPGRDRTTRLPLDEAPTSSSRIGLQGAECSGGITRKAGSVRVA